MVIEKHKPIAIIPARGGSKRMPRKNIIPFEGKPLIAWTIEAALESNIFDKVFVSTDDQEIAAIAQKHGASVPFLRDKYNDDFSPTSAATIYSITQIQNAYACSYQTVVQLMANCPLRTVADIINAYTEFISKQATFQLSCFKFDWMNPWWACRLKENNTPEFIFPDALKKRSQDLESLYCPTGAIWIANVNSLITQETFYGTPLTFFPLDWKAAMDIDNYEDLEMAKALFALRDQPHNNISSI